jgi:phosphohistidine swiveling domain-containing protein
MSLKQLFDRKNMYIYPWYISDLVMTKDIEKISGFRIKKAVVTFEKDYLKMYYESKSANQIGESFLNKLLKNKKFFAETIKNIYKYSEELIAFCQKIDQTQNLTKLSDKQILDLYLEYTERLRILRIWGWVPSSLDGMEKAYLSDYILENFSSFLIKKGKEEQINEYYVLLSSSEKKSEVQTEELARFNLLEKILKNKKSFGIIKLIKQNNYANLEKQYPEVYKLIEKYLKDFGWLTYAYTGPVMSIEYLFKLFNENLQEGDITRQKNNILNNLKNIKKEKAKMINELKLPKELIYAFEVSSEFMYIKDYRKGIYQKSYVSMDRIIDEIARRLGLISKAAKYMIIEEIKDALLHKRGDYYKKIISQRLKKCCYIAENGKIKVYEGKECEEIMKKLPKPEKQENLDKIKEFKGMVAYQGKVRGIVKIVLVEKDAAKINVGDILVSSATNPDLILAMKKAAAFITDTGGIISHAAIISRELKKPCIVGTKIATKVLNDGQLVEVDANRGIVRILKKKSDYPQSLE